MQYVCTAYLLLIVGNFDVLQDGASANYLQNGEDLQLLMG